MKFCLIVSALLVPLVFADHPDQVVSKFLYKNNHVISESLQDSQKLAYSYPKIDDEYRLEFRAGGGNYDVDGRLADYIVFKPSFYKNQSFVVEAYAYEEDEEQNHWWCKVKSGDQAEQVKACYGKIALRAMTEEESKQMQAFEKNNNGPRSFKVIYNKGHIRTQSAGFRTEFQVLQGEADGRTWPRKREFSLIADNSHLDKPSTSRYLTIIGRIPERAFVIENLSADKSKNNCLQTDIVDLMIDVCRGDIQARMLKADD